MSTSDKKMLGKTALLYACATAFCAFFGAVYEVFSHQVYSYFMIYAFAIPLCLGVIPCLALSLGGQRVPCPLSRKLYHSGVAALTVGSIFEGVLRIYGTTNRLVAVYPAAGACLILAAVGAFLAGTLGNRNRRPLPGGK